MLLGSGVVPSANTSHLRRRNRLAHGVFAVHCGRKPFIREPSVRSVVYLKEPVLIFCPQHAGRYASHCHEILSLSRARLLHSVSTVACTKFGQSVASRKDDLTLHRLKIGRTRRSQQSQATISWAKESHASNAGGRSLPSVGGLLQGHDDARCTGTWDVHDLVPHRVERPKDRFTPPILTERGGEGVGSEIGGS